MCPAQVNAQLGVGTCVWQRSRDRAGRAPGDLGTGQASATQGCTSVLTAAQPQQASGREFMQDPRWPLISGSGCLGPGALAEVGPAWTGPWLGLHGGRCPRTAPEGPEEGSVRTLTVGRDLLSKTKGRLQRAAVSGIPWETRAECPGDGPGQERTEQRRMGRQMGLREQRKVGGRGVPRRTSTAWPATRAPQLLPHMGSQVPWPWDPRGGRTSGVQGGGHACPGRGQWDPVEPKSFPRPHRPFPGPASGVNTPTCAPAPPPLPRAWRDSDVCPRQGDGVEGCPPSSATGGGWPVGGPRVSTVQREGGGPRRGCGASKAAPCVSGARWGSPVGQGGAALRSRGCWIPGSQESVPGAGQTRAEGADGLPLLVQAQPWGTVGSRLPSRAPFPAPRGQEAHASQRPDPRSAICLLELMRATEIRHKIISEQSV